MTILRRSLILIAGLYLGFWLAVAAYFTYAENHEDLLQGLLSRVFDRPVTVGAVTTSWNGSSPRVLVQQFHVQGDGDTPLLAFESLGAELDLLSLLRFWPQFTEFVVERPHLEIASQSTNRLQLAGVALRSGSGSGVAPKRLISWLLNHHNMAWLDGTIVWRRLDGSQQQYSETSFVYEREQQERELRVTTLTPKGLLAFIAQASGDVLEANNWDASLEVRGNQGERLLAPEDLSMVVEAGRGRISLKTLTAERLRDILQLSGFGERASWLLKSQLKGRLHDFEFEFSGPLLEFSDWSVRATASDISFESVLPAPAMNKLSGQLSALPSGGSFTFQATESEFNWPAWYGAPFANISASGELRWTVSQDKPLQLELRDASLRDEVISLQNLQAMVEVDTRDRQISNLGQLFKLDSIDELSFEGDQLVSSVDGELGALRPIFLDARLNFEIADFSKIDDYFPKIDRLEKLHTWWSNALQAGHASNGELSYRGEVSRDAIYNGKAELMGKADYADMQIDYGFQRDWPPVTRGYGTATLRNDQIDFQPQGVWLAQDQVLDPQLRINNVFKLERQLQLSGSMKTSLQTVAQLLFNGPLLKPENRRPELPVDVTAGEVETSVEISIPLRRVSRAQVSGTAKVSEGRIVLPPLVPVSNINTTIDFTEKSASSRDVRARFLGHATRGELITRKAAQPPVLALRGSGKASAAAMEPWIGEHLLSWFQGDYPWQGEVEFAGTRTSVSASSNMQGVEVLAPPPLQKSADQTTPMKLAMEIGSRQSPQSLNINIGSHFSAFMAGDKNNPASLLQRGLISLGPNAPTASLPINQDGIEFDIQQPDLDLDAWLSAIIDMARLPVKDKLDRDPVFLDAMRAVSLVADNPRYLGERFGALELAAVSVDGNYWIGEISGDNASGTLQAEPRAEVPSYRFNLEKFHIPAEEDDDSPLEPVDASLSPAVYPKMDVLAESFKLGQRKLGKLELHGEPNGDVWELSELTLEDAGIKTSVTGSWINNASEGTISSFRYETSIDEVGGLLDEMDFSGVLKKGRGTLVGNLNWIGAPHEFDYARLNGDFDLRIKDGELIQVEPGGGKLFGLLNFNALARRLTLDFSDVFSSGLEFDRMRYAGVLADGAAIMQDAYIFSPALFVQMEGKLDLDKELIDMEIHLSPELGGNLTLLSALANPAAGAVMFLTQQLFKDEMRSSTFQSYRALGSWDDYTVESIDDSAAAEQSDEQATATNQELSNN